MSLFVVGNSIEWCYHLFLYPFAQERNRFATKKMLLIAMISSLLTTICIAVIYFAHEIDFETKLIIGCLGFLTLLIVVIFIYRCRILKTSPNMEEENNLWKSQSDALDSTNNTPHTQANDSNECIRGILSSCHAPRTSPQNERRNDLEAGILLVQIGDNHDTTHS